LRKARSRTGQEGLRGRLQPIVQPEAEPAAERLRHHIGETVARDDRGDRLSERA
jgi:hypothetical protein